MDGPQETSQHNHSPLGRLIEIDVKEGNQELEKEDASEEMGEDTLSDTSADDQEPALLVSTSMPNDELTFVKSRRGGENAVYNNFTYHKKRQNDTNIYWYCVEGHRLGCKGALKTLITMDGPQETVHHNHPPIDRVAEQKSKKQRISMETGTNTSSEPSVDNLEPGSHLKKLMEQAMNMREKAYCPYSKFRVGAAVLTSSNSIYTGCNVENASYGLTMCAERVAICNAVTNGSTKFIAMAVCCDIKGDFKGPCGACRQVIVEFGANWTLYCVKPDGTYLKMSVKSLLPLGFYPEALTEERVS